jgi:hypothetical protein
MGSHEEVLALDLYLFVALPLQALAHFTGAIR